MTTSAAPSFAVDAMLAALNHVLAQHPDSALPKLRAHSGALIAVDTVFGTKTWTTPVKVTAEGYLARNPNADVLATEQPRLKISVPISLDHLSTWSRQGFAGLMRQVRIEGDVDLASTIGQLFKEVRWDPEEDLSKVVGDSFAHRLGQSVRSFSAQAKQWSDQTRSSMGQKLSASADAPLVSKTEFAQWQAQLRSLRDAVDRLDQRTHLVK
jgi:ubiquinone biosynthesis accessory factor UbiJ